MQNQLNVKVNNRPRLVMAGMSCLDQIWQVKEFPPTGSRTSVYSYRRMGGGPAATAAATAARLGAEVNLLTLYGNDDTAKALTRELAAYGVSHVLKPYQDVATPVSTVLVAPSGERYIFPYRDPGLFEIRDTWDLSCLPTCNAVLVDTRYSFLCEAVLDEAIRMWLPVVGDFGDAEHWHLAKKVSHLIVSEECARQRCGDARPEEALRQLRQFPAQMVGITLGDKGFYYDCGEGVRHVPAFPVDVVDTTGAGDVFHGAYAHALASGHSPDDCAWFAAAAAALSCRGVGRSALPSLGEVQDFMQQRQGNLCKSHGHGPKD
jgi:sulfofructose kinase